jgi:hypothetical protein
MQPGVALRFKDNKSVEQAFADLGDVDVDSALSWGFYRVVLVKHHAKSNGQQVFPWVHTIACPGRCMFVEEPALAQIASYLFYMTRYGKQTARAAGQGNGMLTLFLNPVFSDKPPLPGLMSDPLELRLVQADAAAQGAGLALLGQLAKYPSEGGALVAAGQALFDAGTPQAYPRKRGDGKTVDEVMWAAYINGVRNKAWTPRYTFQLGSDSAILIAGSAQGDVLFLPFHKVGGGWRLFTTPDKAPFWPLFEGRPFAEAIGKLINKQ